MEKDTKYNNALVIIGLYNSLFFKLENGEFTKEYNYKGTHIYKKDTKAFKLHGLDTYLDVEMEGIPEKFTKNIVKDKIDIFFNYDYYIFSCTANNVYCINLDHLQMTYSQIIYFIRECIEKYNIDQILYSVPNYERTYYDMHSKYIMQYNLSILNRIKKMGVPLLVGGNCPMDRQHISATKYYCNKLGISFFEGKNIFEASGTQSKLPLSKLHYKNNITLLTPIVLDKSVLSSMYGLDAPFLCDDVYVNEIIFKIMQSDCVNKCAFCENSLKPNETNEKICAEQKLEELKRIQKKFGINSLLLLDGYINNEFLMTKFEKSGINLDIIAGVSLNNITPEICLRMKSIGVKIANIGIEAYDDESLLYINKGITIDKINKGIELLHEHNFILNCNFILGMPNRKKSEYEDILRLVSKYSDNVLNSVRLNIFQLLPNSYFFLSPKKFKISIIPTDTGFDFFDGKQIGAEIVRETLPHIINFNNGLGKYQVQHYGFGLQLLLLLIKQYKDKSIVWFKYKEIIDEYRKNRL